MVSAAGCPKISNPSLPGRRKLEPFVEGSRFSSSGAEGFTFFVVVRWRVHVLGALVRKGSEGFAFFVLEGGGFHAFRPDALEGSHFSSSGAEGFTVFVVVRRRVHVLGARVRKGSKGFAFFVLECRRVHISRLLVPEGSHFFACGCPRQRRVQVFCQATAKKSGVQKVRFPYVVSNKKRHFWALAAITGFGGPEVPEGSTFQRSAPSAAKNFEPFDLNG